MADLLVSVAKSFRSARVNVLLLMDSTSFLCFSCPMTVFWSRAHRQRHVTICLMKFDVGERNVAIRYIYFALGCVIRIIMIIANAFYAFTTTFLRVA